MNTDPMRWHENFSTEMLSLVIAQMSARYHRLLVAGGVPDAQAIELADLVFHQSVVSALALGSVDALEAASAAERGRIQ